MQCKSGLQTFSEQMHDEVFQSLLEVVLGELGSLQSVATLLQR